MKFNLKTDFRKVKRGDIFEANLSDGIKKVLVVSNDRGNFHSSTIIVYSMKDDNNVNLCELNTIDKQRLIRFVKKVNTYKMTLIEEMMRKTLIGQLDVAQIAI